MFPGRLDRVSPGDQISAEQENIVRELLGRNITGQHTIADPENVAHRPTPQDHRIVWVRNNSAADVTHGQILCLADLDTLSEPTGALSRFKTEAIYDGSSADDDLVSKYGVVMDGAIGTGSQGRVIVSGECSARINVEDENHDYCDVDAETDTEHLVSQERGNAHILWKEGGTGLQWARIRISNPPPPAGDTTDPDYRHFCVYDKVIKLDCDNPSTAYIMEWDEDACSGYGDWVCTTTTFSIYETLNIYSKPGNVDEETTTPFYGVARKWPDSEHWEILVMENLAHWILFTLDEDLGGASAEATVTDFWQGHDPDDIEWGEDGLKVHDYTNLWPRGASGGYGLACWDDDGGKYVVVNVQQYPQLIQVLAGPFTDTTDPVSCSSGAKMNRAGDKEPGAVSAVDNPFGCSRDDSGQCPATWDAAANEYVLIGPYESSGGGGDVDVTGSEDRSGCGGTASDVETTAVTDIVFDSEWLTVTVDGKEVTIALPTTTQAVVTDVSFDGTKLEQTKKTLTILCAGSPATTTVFTGTTCT